MPTGTLTKKIHGHERVSTRMPPSSRPTAPPPTAIAAQTPSAFVRSAPSLKVAVTIESAAGETRAAPRPCSPRLTISHVEPVARAQSSEADVKSTRPTRKIFLRPARSPARPPRRRKPAEEQRVGVDDPLQVRVRHVEVLLDRRQRDVHDRRVEDDHELRQADEDENEPRIDASGHSFEPSSVAPGVPVRYPSALA